MFGIPESKIIPVSAAEKYNLHKIVDDIVYALPNEKKPGLTNNVKNENLSDKAKGEAKKGFFDTIKDSIKENLPIAVRVAAEAALPLFIDLLRTRRIFRWL